MNREGDRLSLFCPFGISNFLSFCPFGISIFPFLISELVCTKKVFYPILWFPTYSPQADSLLERYRRTDGQRKFFTPIVLFFHWACGPYCIVPTGATLLGWPNYGVDGRLTSSIAACPEVKGVLTPTSQESQDEVMSVWSVWQILKD